MKILEEKGIPSIYGDATNDDLYKELLQRGVKMVISTIRDNDDDWLLIKATKNIDPQIITMVVSNHVDEALELYDAGADYVIMPDHISAHHAGLMLEEVGLNITKMMNKKQEHIHLIKQKVQLGLVSLFKK
jgi:voltage-gated potassium channel Kch